MRYSWRQLLLAVLAIAMAVAVIAYICAPPRYIATALSSNALRTTAPSSTIVSALNGLYREVRRRHFTDDTGRVVFADGGSTDTTSVELVKVMGEFAEGTRTFDDPDGNRVTVKWYSEPKIGTLISWEYAGGQDPQTVSVILQRELAKAGVVIK